MGGLRHCFSHITRICGDRKVQIPKTPEITWWTFIVHLWALCYWLSPKPPAESSEHPNHFIPITFLAFLASYLAHRLSILPPTSWGLDTSKYCPIPPPKSPNSSPKSTKLDSRPSWVFSVKSKVVRLLYPLVNVQKTMENHHLYWENPLFLWPFSIAHRIPHGIPRRGAWSPTAAPHRPRGTADGPCPGPLPSPAASQAPAGPWSVDI